MTPETMHAAIKNAYGILAAKHKLRTIPTGDAVQLYRQKLPVNYGKLLTPAEIAAIPKPDLVDFHDDPAGNSSWKKGRKGSQKDWAEVKLRPDFSHLNARGHYLQACVWAGFLFGVDPTTFSYRPESLSEADAKLAVEKTAKPTSEVKAGDTVTYTVVVENSGNVTVSGIELDDTLVKLSEALQWMVDNQEAVKGAFEAIFGMWLIAKLAAVAGKLAGILMQIETIKAFKGISVAAGASEAGTAAGTSWGASFGSAVMKAVPWLAGLLVFMQNAITPQGNDDLWDEEGNTTELGQSQGITQTKEEAEDEWRNSEEGKESILGGKGDRIEAAGFYTRKQYQTLNDLYRDYTGQENNHYSQEELYNLAKKQFGDDTEQFDQFIRKIYELSRSGGELPTDLPLEWFGVNGEEAEEEMDLDARREYTNEERDLAVQDWFDALKDWWSGNIDDDEYGSDE